MKQNTGYIYKVPIIIFMLPNLFPCDAGERYPVVVAYCWYEQPKHQDLEDLEASQLGQCSWVCEARYASYRHGFNGNTEKEIPSRLNGELMILNDISAARYQTLKVLFEAHR